MEIIQTIFLSNSGIYPIIICILIILLLIMILRKYRADFRLQELKLRQEINEQYISGLEHSNQHLAKELHDGVCNQLLTLELMCGDTNPDITSQVNSIRNEIRFISHSLASPEFTEVSLEKTLKDYFKKLQTLDQIKIHYYSAKLEPSLQLTTVQQHEIYRITQEALANIYKHSQATDIYISSCIIDNQLRIVIEDNGQGYPPCETKDGFGHRSMRSRAKTIQADLSIESQPNNGTIVTLSIPL